MFAFKGIADDRDNRVAIVLILFITVFTGSLAILSEGTFGGADDLSHYKIARYAFRDPSLFFDLWGKPLFTILASPFAQFGFNGIRIFNVLISSATLWISYRVARKLMVPFGWSVIILTAFAPLYLVMSYTGMTEILFAFMVILSTWYFARERYNVAVIILSFIPFVRNEGFVLWLPVLIALVIRSRYRQIPLFATGFIVFSLLGSIIFRDLLWLIHRFPYRGAAEIYGSGSLFHFVLALPQSAGFPVLVLFIISFIPIGISLKKRDADDRGFFYLWFIIMPALTYIAAHSFVWWKGMGSSAGLVRVLAAILPLLSLAGAYGLGFLADYLRRYKIPAYLTVAIILAVMAADGFTHHRHPTELNDEEKLVKEASYWIRSSGMDHRKIYYFNPFLIHFLGLDPYDETRSVEKVPDRDIPSNSLMPGELIAWDSHFGPNEGGLKESVLAGDSLFRLLSYFGSTPGDNTGWPRVAIYERLSAAGQPGSSEWDLYNGLSEMIITDTVTIPFEEFEGWYGNSINITGNREAYQIGDDIEFSPNLNIPLTRYSATPLVMVQVEATIIAGKDIGRDKVLLVTSLDNKGRPYIYLKQDFAEVPVENGYSGNLTMTIPAGSKSDDHVSVYIWNRAKSNFYIETFNVTLFLAGGN